MSCCLFSKRCNLALFSVVVTTAILWHELPAFNFWCEREIVAVHEPVINWAEVVENQNYGELDVYKSLPTPNFPFVYFHNRKTGGSTFRHFIFNASDVLNLTSFVSCFNVDCQSKVIPRKGALGTSLYSVYAGHFNYDDVVNKLGFSRGARHMQFHHNLSFSCLTTIRPIVERVASCWDYSMVQNQEKPNKPSVSMSPDDWNIHLPFAFHCCNELVRNFGSISTEHIVNTLDLQHLGPRRLDVEVQFVSSRLMRCVVLKLGRHKENRRILGHFLPWLEPFYSSSTSNKGSVNNRTRLKELSQDVSRVILEHNRIDTILHDVALRIHNTQHLIASGLMTIDPWCN